MSTYTPAEYAREVLDSGVHPKTVVNWIKRGLLEHPHKVTPTGRYLIIVDDSYTDSVEQQFIEIMQDRMRM